MVISSGPLKIITLVPLEPREDWLKQCIESVSSQEVELEHYLIPCCDLYSGRKGTYNLPGIVVPVDYDDWLEPGILKEVVAAVSGGSKFVFTGMKPAHTSRVKRSSMTIHHLTAFESSLVPESFYQEIEYRGLEIHVDWLVKAYIFLTCGGTRIPKHGYNWRRHEGQFSFINRGNYGRITHGCIELLNEIPVKPGFTVSN